MRAKLLYLMIIFSTFLNASEITSGGTDILPRTVNFIIFAAIIYYLLADWIRYFFKNRSAAIAAKLESIQAQLKDAKEQKEKAKKELENAKKLAKEIVEIAKKESQLISKKIESDAEDELKIIEKIFNENCLLEERKMVRDVVKMVLSETFDEKNIAINEKEFLKLLEKKVG